MDPKLFERINTLWEERENLDLTSEQQRVLDAAPPQLFVRRAARGR